MFGEDKESFEDTMEYLGKTKGGFWETEDNQGD